MKSLPTWPARRAQLAQWYAGARRDLPWRRTTDPYAIVVSELMLQQTQVVTVIPYYERWLAQFPTWSGVGLVAAVFVTGNLLEGYVIYPRFLGDRVELHAVWVIFALFAAGAAFGFVGVLLAVPVTAVIGVMCRFWLRRYIESPLYLDPPSPGAEE